MKKKLNQKKVWLVIGLISLLILNFTYYQLNKEFHIHADFKVNLNGSYINFSNDQFQSTSSKNLHEFVHLHDSNGDVIHYHERNQNLSDFFSSLGMELNELYFIDHNGFIYETNSTHKLSVFVNGKEISDHSSYVAKDLDQILIIYHQVDIDISQNLKDVTDKACIESAKCPERGEPSEGSCVTGSSCGVDINALLNE